MIRSLRLRLMLAATTLAVLFMLALLPAMQGAFSLALQDSIEQRLASDVTTLISAARVESNRLLMPTQLPDERFDVARGENGFNSVIHHFFERFVSLAHHTTVHVL